MLMELLSPLLARFGRTAFIGLLVVLMKGSYLRAPVKWETSYDYVIVGGGAAGCVLANRLSEDPSTSVLLLEAGPEDNFLADIPIFQTYVRGSPLDWNFVSEPNRFSNLEADGQKMGLFQGKVLGGTTVINAMLYVRGSRYDYDSWQSLGADGWSYQSNLKYFIKSERNHVNSIKRSPYHGTSGPVDVNLPRYKPKLGVIFNEAGRMLGYRSRIDHNGASAVGFAIPQSSMSEGRRISAATAYLDPIIGRRNLRVVTYATVTRINFNSRNRATGVTFLSTKKNGYYTVHAQKEVILSAGAISSPKLLMLSGIGDCDNLERVGIKCRINRPAVGRNLMDHIGGGSMVFLTNDSDIITSVRDINPRSALEYFTQKKGPLSSTLVDGLAFINTRNGTSARSPDVEFILGSASLLSDYGSTLQRSERMSSRLWNEYRPYSGQDSFVIYPVLLTPKSRGRITLRSSDPFAHPKVDMNYLSRKEDVETLVKGMKTVLKLVSQPPLQAIQSRLVPIRFPLCPRASFCSDEYLRCALKSYTVSFWHFSGTARMGQVDDDHSVVDSRLRVIGTSALRVVDASVMPLVTTGHLQASVYMIAEKAADMIKGRI